MAGEGLTQEPASRSIGTMETNGPDGEQVPQLGSANPVYSKQLGTARAFVARSLGVGELPEGDPERVAAARQSDWLMGLYEAQRLHLEGDLDRSWGVQQLFVPLSLAPFAAVVAVLDLGLAEVSLLAAGSVFLLTVGLLHTERIGNYQRRSWIWVEAIQAELGLPEMGLFPPKQWTLGTKHWRWLLLIGVVVLWVLLIVATAAGVVGSE